MNTSNLASSQQRSQVAARNVAITIGQQMWQVRLTIALIGFALLFFMLLFYFNACYVSGTEIDSQTWQIRDFYFRRDPFTNRQLTGVVHSAVRVRTPIWTANASNTASNLDPSISALFPAQPARAARWDLVTLNQFESIDGGASVLTELLAAEDASFNSYWVQWTAAHPQHAKTFWPAAYQLVYYQLYADLPRLFAIAVRVQPLSEFDAAIRDAMHEALLAYCQSEADLEKIAYKNWVRVLRDTWK